MAVQAFTYLVITDGTDSCVIADGSGGTTKYLLVDPGWAPAIAGTKDSSLGGGSPYADVIEEITIDIADSSAALCYADLAVVARLFDKADRWWNKGENISPVVIKYAPQGSTVASTATPYQAIVLGRAAGDQTSGVKLPMNFDNTGMLFEIDQVVLRFWRRGLWTGATESASATAVANPALLSVTMPSSPTMAGPIEVDFTGFTSAASTGLARIPRGFVFVGPTNAFSLQEAEAFTSTASAGTGTATSIADAGARASAGSVLRINHSTASAAAITSVFWTLPAAFLNSKRIAVYCNYRNNGAASWTVQAQAYRTVANNYTGSFAPVRAIAAAANDPTVLFVGIIGARQGFDTLALHFICPSGTTKTLDLDTIMVMDVSDPRVYALVLTPNESAAFFFLGSTYASKNLVVSVDNNPNGLEVPFAHLDVLTTSLQLPIGYTGDAGLVASGSALQVCWFATHEIYWRTQDVALAAALSIGATITRRLGYLTPE